ncbi:CD209 antigen-like protein E isoform X2 [Eleginops maclovinus]|uniref:CD209 antigen-like protein E isoform X2 n=1 Tax=Eleginops maclovinus TaxID=56733 RepID=UPI00307FE364
MEVSEYQQFPESQPEHAAVEKTPKTERLLLPVLLTVALLIVLQAALNLSLRLSLSQPAAGGERGGERGGEPEQNSCPEGWLMFGSSCYFFSNDKRSWDGGQRDCEQRGAHLVIIDSRQEQNFLTGFRAAAWVGMTDRETEGTWVWVDGTPVNRQRLLWAPGQPDNSLGGEDCGDLRTMSQFLGLNDSICSAREQWICEKSL